jgi:hypothetical protein
VQGEVSVREGFRARALRSSLLHLHQGEVADENPANGAPDRQPDPGGPMRSVTWPTYCRLWSNTLEISDGIKNRWPERIVAPGPQGTESISRCNDGGSLPMLRRELEELMKMP